jgi:hypothetical protein
MAAMCHQTHSSHHGSSPFLVGCFSSFFLFLKFNQFIGIFLYFLKQFRDIFVFLRDKRGTFQLPGSLGGTLLQLNVWGDIANCMVVRRRYVICVLFSYIYIYIYKVSNDTERLQVANTT